MARSKVTAEEALEFLTTSGGQLCQLFFGVPPVAFKAAVQNLVDMSRTLKNGNRQTPG